MKSILTYVTGQRLTIALVGFTIISSPRQGLAVNHTTHFAKHNMVLFGDSEVFASHVVYKVPHNYQVVLQLVLLNSEKLKLDEARAAFPNDSFFYLLDPMDIS